MQNGSQHFFILSFAVQFWSQLQLQQLWYFWQTLLSKTTYLFKKESKIFFFYGERERKEISIYSCLLSSCCSYPCPHGRVLIQNNSNQCSLQCRHKGLISNIFIISLFVNHDTSPTLRSSCVKMSTVIPEHSGSGNPALVMPLVWIPHRTQPRPQHLKSGSSVWHYSIGEKLSPDRNCRTNQIVKAGFIR